MEVLCPQRTCNKLHLLQPIKNNTRYYVVLNVDCHDWGQKITLRSPLQVIITVSITYQINGENKCVQRNTHILPGLWLLIFRLKMKHPMQSQCITRKQFWIHWGSQL